MQINKKKKKLHTVAVLQMAYQNRSKKKRRDQPNSTQWEFKIALKAEAPFRSKRLPNVLSMCECRTEVSFSL